MQTTRFPENLWPDLNPAFVRCVLASEPMPNASCADCCDNQGENVPAVALYADSWGLTMRLCAHCYLSACEARP
jgi:hypothetical protein